MTQFKSISVLALMAAVVAAPLSGSAQNGYYDRDGRYHRAHHQDRRQAYDRRSCEERRRSHGNNGTAIGAVTGGVLGSAMGNGRFGNVLLGAGAGALAGHAIGRSTAHC